MPRKKRQNDENSGCERIIPLGASSDKSSSASYPGNTISTSKYRWWSFLPLVTFEQFQKRANLYFTFITLLMYVGEHSTFIDSTVSWWSTAAVLIPMMGLSMIISGLDDLRRHQSDRQINSQQARVIRLGGKYGVYLDTFLWKNIHVGDVIVLKSDEELPADIVPLACSGSDGQCYVSTANLDGETNLKIKACATEAQAFLCEGHAHGPPLLDQAVEKLAVLDAALSVEAPSKSITKFSGSLNINHSGVQSTSSLSASNLLLRGTRLRNTAWLFGSVVYTGPHTRMVMNSRDIPTKMANLERVVNRAMLVVLGAQALLSSLSSILYVSTEYRFRTSWYLYPSGTWVTEGVASRLAANWFKFFILYSNLMPISLYATMEICNYAQAFFVKSDLLMYDEEQDCPAAVRSTNLCHELGQISYIFSDKTGTLTQNVMELKRVSISGQVFGEVTEEPGFSDVAGVHAWRQMGNQKHVDAFLEILAVAHTVMVTTDRKGSQCYEAESPDEGALVEGAKQMGWHYCSRTADSIAIDMHRQSQTYKILGVNTFNSTRKRMSSLVRSASGETWLLVKGADNVMMDRAEHVPAWLTQSLTNFSLSGLRTLVLGRRRLDEQEVQAWLQTYDAAQCALEDRDAKLEAAAEQIEVKLQMVGVTGIEDKLQVGVPDTITKLREAGIQLWVLTGDKLETARNIGFSTNLLSADMDIRVLEQSENVRHALQELASTALTPDEGGDSALMVTGAALEQVTSVGLLEEFLQASSVCSVVIACRVSPLQKAQLVRLVRESSDPQPVTLAIGDGANDVPMIQEAHVGVGVSGKEGRQAVNASDFAIAQFRFLERLLLVHGRWDYRRTCKFILYTFWRNAIITMLLFYYTFFSGYSGTCMFTSTVWTSFSMILFWPIIATGISDRDVTAKQAVEHPSLYETGRLGLDLNITKMVEMLLSAFVHSFVIMTIAVVAVMDLDVAATGSYYSFGFMVFSWVVLTMNYRATFITTTYNFVFLAALAVSFLTYLLFACVYCSLPSMFPEVYGTFQHVVRNPVFWMGSFAVPLLAVMIDMFKAYLMLEFFPDQRDLILEQSLQGKLSDIFRDTKHDPQRRGSRSSSFDRSATWHTGEMSAISSSYAFSFPEGQRVQSLGALPRLQRDSDTTLLDNLASGRPSPRPSPSFATIASSDSDSGGSTGTASSAAEPKLQKPRASNFSQQTMPSVQFALNRKVVLVALISSGVLFVLMGFATLLYSLSSSQFRVVYEAPDDWYVGAGESKKSYSGEILIRPCHEPQRCAFPITVPADLDPPIQVYYEVTPFLQNYYTYISSVAWQQLEGKNDVKAPVVCETRTRQTQQGEEIFPCGLMATSVFNDTFEIEGIPIDTESSDMPVWREFHNPPDYPERPNVSWLYERYPTVTSRALGIQSKRFIAWMLPNFLNRAGKPYGVVSQPLKKGQLITLHITSTFRVQALGATKTLLLTRGAQNYTLAYILLTSGALCSALVATVFAVYLSCGRQPGKPRQRLSGFSTNWRHGPEFDSTSSEEESSA
ncbi:putative phospholipid-transporting ATPase DRS2 [Symbiodinium microadriaticum]|uniref:Phospholipid-transporting ATPase n=1 Tax=Symbiodinium microadriaticum TaxID=2951 RepID=A0A1Q9DPM2_SYMMI|nr:putative phospholipid-transporting ATPase DRS2 [Symbiodinium microadriaticum]CAE7251714.1 DRS2 [Symbiodinium microadriaticum]CAE7935399.1 DRS2 [Symbiodinium sp. KB8]